MAEVVTDEMLESDTVMRVGATAGGFMAASVGQSLFESYSNFELPNEAYGLLVAFAGFYTDFEYSEEVAIGGGMMALDAVAQRFGIQEAVRGKL